MQSLSRNSTSIIIVYIKVTNPHICSQICKICKKRQFPAPAPQTLLAAQGSLAPVHFLHRCALEDSNSRPSITAHATWPAATSCARQKPRKITCTTSLERAQQTVMIHPASLPTTVLPMVNEGTVPVHREGSAFPAFLATMTRQLLSRLKNDANETRTKG